MQTPMQLFSHAAKRFAKSVEISDFAENVIASGCKQFQGVSTVRFGAEKICHAIWIDPAKLASFKLTPLDVKQSATTGKKNVELPAGKIEGNKQS